MQLQMIFQDPYASLDPRQRVRDIVMEPRRAQAGGKLSRRELHDEAIALRIKCDFGIGGTGHVVPL